MDATAQTLPHRDLDRVRLRLARRLLETEADSAGRPIPDSSACRWSPETVAVARQSFADMRADGSWADIDYADRNQSSWRSCLHFDLHLLPMALAYAGSESPLLHDPALGRAIDAATRFWLGARLANPNWWWNQIGLPVRLGDLLVLTGEVIPDELRRACAPHFTPPDWDDRKAWTGQNTLWVCLNQVKYACTTLNSSLLQAAFARAWDEVKIAADGEEGIQPDFSFHQHGQCLYSGGYGLQFAEDMAGLVMLADDTASALPKAKAALFANLLLEGHCWMVRGMTFDYSACGRSITRPGHDAGALRAACRLLGNGTMARREELAACEAAWRSGGSAVLGNRHFWKADYMTHHRPGFFASVRMLSSRMENTDIMCYDYPGEGRTSHHLADGALFIMRDGGEYRDIFAAWDWRMIPGITVEYGTETLDYRAVRRRGVRRFVGGVSDGAVGLAAMDFERDALSAHKAWCFLDDAIVCLGAGIASSTEKSVRTCVNQCHLRGDVWLAQGPVVRRLDPGRHDLQGPCAVWHDGVGYYFPESAPVCLVNGPRSGRWSDSGVDSKEEVTLDVFTVWLEHGVGPRAESYRYWICPDVGPADFAGRLAAPPVQHLTNTLRLQAAWDPAAGLLQAAFYEAGACAIDLEPIRKPFCHKERSRFRLRPFDGAQGRPAREAAPLPEEADRLSGRLLGHFVSVDRPCLILVRVTATEAVVSVANPENQPGTVTIECALPGFPRHTATVAFRNGGTALRFPRSIA